MRIALIFNRTRPDTTGIYFERACRKLGITGDHWELGRVAEIPGGYDCYLRIDHGDDYLVPWPSRLRPAVFYAIDTHLPKSRRKIRQAAGWYDAVCCAQYDAARRLPHAAWVPLACDDELHAAVPAAPEWDVACVGSEGGAPRKFYLQALRERYPRHCIGHAEHAKLASIYSRACIGFNYSIAHEVNMRVFEVLAAGTLLVTNVLPADDLTRLGLEDRRHLVVYRTPRELMPLIDYFLAHEDERRAIAQAGCAVVRARHTYAHRLTALLAFVETQCGLVFPAAHQELLPCASS